jgi:hypothetical protein
MGSISVFYGFPSAARRAEVPLCRVALPTDGTAKTFLLPSFASTQTPIRAYLQTAAGTAWVVPGTYQLLRAYGADLINPSLTVTGSGTTPANVADSNDATAWQGNYANSGQTFTIDLGVSRSVPMIAQIMLYTETSRYINGFRWDASVNGAAWTPVVPVTANTVVGSLVYTPTTSLDAWRYWRFTVTSVSYLTYGAVATVKLFDELPGAPVTGLSFPTAPAAGSLIVEYAAA